MIVLPNADRRVRRYLAARQEIVEAAWDLISERGPEGLSLRLIAERLGMQSASLYTYFPSKAAILDAMCAEGWRAARERMAGVCHSLSDDAHDSLRAVTRAWIDFCLEDDTRFALMLQPDRTGVQMSEQSLEERRATWTVLRDALQPHVIDDRATDMMLAVASGVVGLAAMESAAADGERARLVDEAIELVAGRYARR